MPDRGIGALVVLLLALLMGGCTTTGNMYAPESSFTSPADIAALKEKYVSATSIEKYYSQPETKQRRNEFIAGRLVLYDLSYVDFVTKFRFGRAAESTILDTATLGIAQAITFLGGERTKEVLGAISGAIIGTRASYEKNFFDEQAAGAIASQMNAERKTALVPIMAGTKAEIDEYPLSVALMDLANYQYAGTIDGALSSIQRDAGIKESKATAALDRYRTDAFAPDDSSERIWRWLFPGMVGRGAKGEPVDEAGAAIQISTAHLAALRAEIARVTNTNPGEIPLHHFIDNAKFRDNRKAVLTTLEIP